MNISDLESRIKSDPYNPAHHIALARAYLDEGDEERARRVVAIKRKLPSKDPAVHFEWGRLGEELGMAAQARESYEQAVALDPTNPDYHFRTAFLHYERGGWERALKHLEKTVALSQENAEAQRLLASLYEEMGFKKLARGLRGLEERKAGAPPSVLPSGPSGRDISLILSLFKGREFGYARFVLGTAGSVSFDHVNGIIGDQEILQHLSGESTYGMYPLRSDRTLNHCAIHIRIPWRRLVANIKNSGFLVISESHVHDYARKIVGKAEEFAVPAYLEDPGDRERRIWFFFQEFIPMELSRRFLNAILDKVPAPGLDLSVDLLLGYRASGIGHEDSPVALPLGINPRTGKRSLFIDEEGEPSEDQFLFVRKIRPISRRGIKALLKSDRRSSISIPLQGLRHLQEKCPVVNDILLKAHSGRNLRPEEKQVLFFILGFLPDGCSVLHHVLEPCPDYRPKKVDQMVSRLGAHPVSCPKIRHLLPDTTAYVRCDCSFDLPAGNYPSPLLHLKVEGKRGKG